MTRTITLLLLSSLLFSCNKNKCEDSTQNYTYNVAKQEEVSHNISWVGDEMEVYFVDEPNNAEECYLTYGDQISIYYKAKANYKGEDYARVKISDPDSRCDDYYNFYFNIK